MFDRKGKILSKIGYELSGILKVMKKKVLNWCLNFVVYCNVLDFFVLVEIVFF